MIKPPQDATRTTTAASRSAGDFISFEKIEIETGTRLGFNSYYCRIKSLRDGNEIDLNVQIELPHSDKTLSEIRHQIAEAIHEATNPAHLNR